MRQCAKRIRDFAHRPPAHRPCARRAGSPRHEARAGNVVVDAAALTRNPGQAMAFLIIGFVIFGLGVLVRIYFAPVLSVSESSSIAQLLTCAALGPAVLLVMARTRRWAWGLATALGGIALLVVLPLLLR